MMLTRLTTTAPKDREGFEMGESLTFDEYCEYWHEIDEQPAWRRRADKEMDYYNGNQLTSEIMESNRLMGVPNVVEPLIGPAIDSVTGLEKKNRADWRVDADSDNTSDQLAKAMGFKLNQAERKSKADKACSDAYLSQVGVGIGWVEVARNSNPFEFPYVCRAIHRNEIWWDMLSTEADLSDARWLIRRRWTSFAQIKKRWSKKADLVDQCASSWYDYTRLMGSDGGASTGLAAAFEAERGWSVEEQQWRDAAGKRGCLFEVWYRRWVSVVVITTPDGRTVEVDKKNPLHVVAIASGYAQPERVVVPKMRKAVYLGPHQLEDGPTPHAHQQFPYVAFWGKKEDRTGVPFGLIKNMIFMQDTVNSLQGKLRWGISSVQTTRTEGAVLMSDSEFRDEVGRVDSDIVLSAKVMATPGAVFKVERNFQLNQQQWQMLEDARRGIDRVAGISDALKGTRGTARSGVQEATQLEQSTQMLADLNDNFMQARAQVGEQLLSFIVTDMGLTPETILIKGQSIHDDMAVLVNQPKKDPETGIEYLDNDLQRALLKVAVNDVPSTNSYKAQQLSAMSEAFKSMPPEFQRVTMPYLVALMDLPSDSRQEIIKAVREAAKMPTPEDIEKQIAEAVAAARHQDSRDLKLAELAAKYSPERLQAEITKMVAEAFKTTTDALYAVNQTAASMTMNPGIAPVADRVAVIAGYRPPNPTGQDPNFIGGGAPALGAPASAGQPAAQGLLGAPRSTNPTSPALPPGPPTPTSGDLGPGEGSETLSTADNLPVPA